MSAPIAVAAGAFAAVFASILALQAVVGRRPAAVRRRLDDHAVAVAVAEAKRRERINILKEQSLSAIPAVDAVLRRLPAARAARRELRYANLQLTVARYLLLRACAGVAAGAALWLASGLAYAAMPGALLGLMLPRLGLRLKAARRRRAFEAQLAEAVDLLVGALRAGYGFLQGLEAITREMEGPIPEEFRRVLDQVTVGANPIDLLQELSERINSYDFALLAAAVSVQRTAGGNLAEVLENIAKTVRERRRVRGEVRAITTGPRVSSYVLGFIPLALLLWFTSTNADYRHVMIDSSFGKMLIAFAGVWSLLGMALSRTVAKVEY